MPNISKMKMPNGVTYDISGGGGGGTSDYTDLSNKPKINNVTLSGNKTSSDLGVASENHNHDGRYYTETEIDNKLSSYAKQSDIPTVPTNVSAFVNDSGYLTEHQSLAEYVKTNDSRLSDARTPLAHTHPTSDIIGLNIPSKESDLTHDMGYATETYVGGVRTELESDISEKQDSLVSGTNIKTINNQSILGEGNISVGGGGGTSDYEQLSNKPSIGGVVLSGNKTASDLGLSPSSHNHDDRYYTEGEVDTLISGRAPSSHTHSISDIIDHTHVVSGNGDANLTYNTVTDATSFTLPAGVWIIVAQLTFSAGNSTATNARAYLSISENSRSVNKSAYQRVRSIVSQEMGLNVSTIIETEVEKTIYLVAVQNTASSGSIRSDWWYKAVRIL